MGLKEAGLRGSLRSVSTGVPPIPDSDIFQNPIYRFGYWEVNESDGTSPFDLPEVIAGLSDATAVGGPTYNTDQEGTAAGEYDGVDDGHDVSADSQHPSGNEDISVAALVYPRNATDEQNIYTYGDSGEPGIRIESGIIDGEVSMGGVGSGFPLAQGGTVPTDEWITMGGLTDSNTAEMSAVLNGSFVATDSNDESDVTDDNHSIAYNASIDGSYANVFIGDMIICDGTESEAAFQEYHDEWMQRLG